ncbi:MAG: preprotein translocase subunit SecE [Fimbriimonadaceae bacterium]|nr:preprotein translocase subunit SecE [Fimbriimonadaceae bacterium]
MTKDTDEVKSTKPKASAKMPSPTSRRGPRTFLKDVQRESRQVTWPTPQETTRLTGTVLGVCVLVTGILYILSIGIDQIFRMLRVH